MRSPADAWLALRMVTWRLAVPLLKRLLPLPRLAQLLWKKPRRAERDPAREERVMTLADALSGPRGSRRLDNCLDRSLIGYRFLSHAGADPELVIGVARAGEEVRGHVWLRLDGVPLRETDDSLEGFEEVAAFGPAGALSARGAPSDVLASIPSRPDLWH
jgi:hypothetical protein